MITQAGGFKMTNLKGCNDYTIGLDLGIGSVGWAVIDNQGKLCKYKGKKTWGARLFPEAETAKSRRQARCARRRLNRKKQRIEELQAVFAEEMYKVDPDFFNKLKYSKMKDIAGYLGRTLPEEYYEKDEEEKAKFPTIYHLRYHLMTSDEKADIRLVYLALHHIMKARGHFLNQNPELKASNANSEEAVEQLRIAIRNLFDDEDDLDVEIENKADVIKALNGEFGRGSVAAQKIEEALGAQLKKLLPSLGKALIGHKCNWQKFDPELDEVKEANFKLSDENAKLKFEDVCPERLFELYEAAEKCYSSYVLADLLEKDPITNEPLGLSESMIRKYNRHKEDLAELKEIYKQYFGDAKKSKTWYMFSGPKDKTGDYDIKKILHKDNKNKFKGSYTAYILGEKFIKENTKDAHTLLMERIEKDLSVPVCEEYASDLPVHGEDESKEKWHGTYLELIDKDLRDKILERDDRYLQKQRYKFNGAIPNQLQREELLAIIDKQKNYYDFLRVNREHLKKVCESRIPYYVGPLNSGHSANAWAVKKEGIDSVKGIRPWNFDDYIEREKSADLFIKRMTGKCQQLHGEDVLPKCSLLYQEYCVRQELNVIKLVEGNLSEGRPISRDDANDLYDNLFKKQSKVSHNDVIEYFKYKGRTIKEIIGTQGKTGFESKLTTLQDFKKILNVENFEDQKLLSKAEAEEIIKWSTVFEDRDIFIKKLKREFGDRLSDQQIGKFADIRYKGWGRFSKKFLSEISVKIKGEDWTVIKILKKGDPSRKRNSITCLSTILNNDDLGLNRIIEEFNEKYINRNSDNLKQVVDQAWASPTYKRAIRQAQKVVNEIVSIAGYDPSYISIEVTREEKEKVATTTRKRQIEKMLEEAKKDCKFLSEDEAKELKEELKEYEKTINQEMRYLYFLQEGKSLYSKKKLDINRLSEECEVDHLNPQFNTNQDSLANKALILKGENQRKTSDLLLPLKTINEMKDWWGHLVRIGAMSKRKYESLTCTNIDKRMINKFIEKNLTETSQIAKFAEEVLKSQFEATKFRKVRAVTTSAIRRKYELPKVRWANNFHHAHDAYLAAAFTVYINAEMPNYHDNQAIIEEIERHNKKLTGQKEKHPSENGYFVWAFGNKTISDTETGEILWDGEDIIKYVNKVFYQHDVLISRLCEQTSGAFSNETLISPKLGGNLLPTLSGKKVDGRLAPLDPKLYGGSDTFFMSYFVVYAVQDDKDNISYKFDGVPILISKKIDEGEIKLEDFLTNEYCTKEGIRLVKILRKKVYTGETGTIIEIDGQRVRIGGKTGIRNELLFSREPSFGKEEYSLLKKVDQVVDKNQKKIKNLVEENWDEEASLNWLKLNNIKDFDQDKWKEATQIVLDKVIRLDKYRDIEELIKKYNLKEELEQSSNVILISIALKMLIEYEAGSIKSLNLKEYGGGEQEGTTRKNIANLIEEITWIDQSVTGMREKQTSFEDLVDGL